MNAIQRMRRERRIAIAIFAVFAFVALLVHWCLTASVVHAPRTTAPMEFVE